MQTIASDVVPAPGIAESAKDEIFELLKRKGPLCASQISVELLVPLREVTTALRLLRDDGVVEPRRSDALSKDFDEECAPWGLRKSLRRR